jgi:hypothetical protein
MSRTTLAAHESGQNRLSPRMARIYGEAFGAHADWLPLGVLPSGYPARIEKNLDQLAQLHNARDSSARMQFPSPPPRSSTTFSLPARPQGGGSGKARPAVGDVVPEISTEALVRAMSAGGTVDVWSVHAERTWWVSGTLPA